MSSTRALYPVFLDLAGKDVLVVGGGAVATRKAIELAAQNARVRVVAPEGTDELATLSVPWERRAFEDRDLEGAWLVVAATDDEALQRRIAAACTAMHVFCIAVDDPANASAYGASVLRRGPLTVAISTSGEAPALARLFREILEEALPDEGFVEAARALREKWKAERTPMGSRFGELVRAFKARA